MGQGRRGGGSTASKCNRELASLAPLGDHASRSLISASSSSESEDFSGGSGAISGTVRRKRKQQGRYSSGGNARHRSKRSKKEKEIRSMLHVGTEIRTHFEEGWYDGKIIETFSDSEETFKVYYEKDGEEWDFTLAELSDKRKHQIIGAQI